MYPKLAEKEDEQEINDNYVFECKLNEEDKENEKSLLNQPEDAIENQVNEIKKRNGLHEINEKLDHNNNILTSILNETSLLKAR